VAGDTVAAMFLPLGSALDGILDALGSLVRRGDCCLAGDGNSSSAEPVEVEVGCGADSC
jgi:hypothetical protein